MKQITLHTEKNTQTTLFGWATTLTITIFGAILRFWNITTPKKLVFDESYYVKDAYSLLKNGGEMKWPENANDAFHNGNLNVFLEIPHYAIHPPLGKWMIALGMQIFPPESPLAWRFTAATIGTLSILLTAIIAKKLLGSIFLGNICALLLAIDGHHIAHSRTALLDIFLMFWILLTFWMLLLDKEHFRQKIVWKNSKIAFRPWQIAFAICLALAVSTKWSALYYIAAFTAMSIFWDANVRRNTQNEKWFTTTIKKDTLPKLFTITPIILFIYLTSWAGWFLSPNGYNRNWAENHPTTRFTWIPEALRSLWNYHETGYNSLRNIQETHPYAASPWKWLLQIRPTSFYFEQLSEVDPECQNESCEIFITSLGNPLIWWAAIFTLPLVFMCWLKFKDWRAGTILCAIAAGYLPWFLYQDRTIFSFYSIVFLPYLIMGLVYVLGKILHTNKNNNPNLKRIKIILVAMFIVLVVISSAYFYPINAGAPIPQGEWQNRMWLPGWR